MTRLSGKTALVTGAASGIGLAVATRFAAEGARVVIADRDGDAARVAAARIQAEVASAGASANSGGSDCGPGGSGGSGDSRDAEAGRGDAANGARSDRNAAAGSVGSGGPREIARAVTVDISDESQVAAAFSTLIADGWSPNVVVANAGVQLFGQDAKAADLDLDVWKRTLDINLTGTFLTVKHAVRAMLAAGGGSIILTGSPTGVTGEGNDFTAYSTTKAGIHGLGRTVAAAYATEGIRVNTVVPSYVETPLVESIRGDEAARAAITSRIPMGRPATPDDLTGIMTFLASDDSAFATGAMFTVDGGMTTL